MARFNREKPGVFNTIQAHRHDKLAYLEASHARAKAGGYTLGVKLVRAPTWEERARAQAHGTLCPIHETKEGVDTDFDAGLIYRLDHIEDIAFCAATHNEEVVSCW